MWQLFIEGNNQHKQIWTYQKSKKFAKNNTFKLIQNILMCHDMLT